MSSTEERVTSIIWGFDDDNLLLNTDNRNERRRYDIAACARKYKELCEQRLQKEYPKADIQVIYRINPEDDSELLPNTIKTRVTIEDDWDEKDFDPDINDIEVYNDSYHVERVEAICTDVYHKEIEQWQEEKKWRSIVHLSKRSQIPVFMIRLACQQKIIQDFWIDEGVWKVLSNDFTDFSVKFMPYLQHEVLTIITNSSQDYSIQGMKLTDFLTQQGAFVSNTSYWLLKADWLSLPSIYENNSMITLAYEQSQLTLTLHLFNDGNKLNEVDWTFDAFAKSLILQTGEHTEIEVFCQEYGYLQGHIESVQIKYKCRRHHRQSFNEQIEQAIQQIKYITQDAKIALEGGIKWKAVYEKKPEDRFRREVLEPLLRHMNYIDVRNRHGTDEYGRDFTFSEQTRFGELLHYGLQAKAGKISGKANKDIENLLSQVKRAFDMPYYEPPHSAEKRYISVFIIAISGEFTKEAQKIIQELLPKSQIGSVFFWDKTKIKNLINQIWPQER